MVGVHGEMKSIKGDLQRLGPLEVKVDSMLEKLSMLEMREKCYKYGRIQKMAPEGNPIELSYCHS